MKNKSITVSSERVGYPLARRFGRLTANVRRTNLRCLAFSERVGEPLVRSPLRVNIWSGVTTALCNSTMRRDLVQLNIIQQSQCFRHRGKTDTTDCLAFWQDACVHIAVGLDGRERCTNPALLERRVCIRSTVGWSKFRYAQRPCVAIVCDHARCDCNCGIVALVAPHCGGQCAR